jgi:hypothetical protein
MVICFGDHCFEVVVVQLPILPPHPGGPINYPWFLRDATVLASIEAATTEIDKSEVREELLKGIALAKQAVQRLAEDDRITIHDDFPSS